LIRFVNCESSTTLWVTANCFAHGQFRPTEWFLAVLNGAAGGAITQYSPFALQPFETAEFGL